MKIIIGIPVYLSDELLLDFTQQTINSIHRSKMDHEYEIVVVNNYCSPRLLNDLANLTGDYILNETNCLASAWNKIIERGIHSKADYIIIPNNDLLFHPDCITNLVNFAESHPEFIMWTASEHSNMRTINDVVPGDSFDDHPHFSCFMVSPKSIKFLMDKELGTKEPFPGRFDENFKPAYFEDQDMHNRILRAGFKAGKTASALFYHFGSRTIKIDEELNMKNKRTYENNRAYFIRKWSWDPHNNVTPNDSPIRFRFKEPFGGK